MLGIPRLLGFVLLVAFAVGASSPALAQTPPNDAAKHYVLVLASGSSKAMIEQWFATHPGLRALAGRLHYMTIDPSDTQHSLLYAERYEESVPLQDLPAVLFMRGDGGVIYKASRENLPITGDALYEEMRTAYSLARERLPSTQQMPEESFDQYNRTPRRIRDTRILSPPGTVPGGMPPTTLMLLALAAVVAFFIVKGSN